MKNIDIKINIDGTGEVKDLNQVIKDTSGSFDGLKKRKEILEKAFANAKFGTPEFKTLQAEVRKTNTRLKELDETISDITFADKVDGLFKFGQAAAGAFSLASVGASEFGDAMGFTEEEIQKTEQSFLKLIVVMDSFSSISQAFSKDNKLFNAIQSVNFSLGRMPGLMKTNEKLIEVFGKAGRTAIASIGIGILIGGIALIADNWDKIVKKFNETFPIFKELGDSGLTFKAVWEGVLNGLGETISQFVGILKSTIKTGFKLITGDFSGVGKEFENLKNNVKGSIGEISKSFKSGVDEVKKDTLRLKDISNLKDINSDLERSIKLFEASGKDVGKLKSDLLKNNIEIAKKTLGGFEEGSKEYKEALQEVKNAENDFNVFIQEKRKESKDKLSSLQDAQFNKEKAFLETQINLRKSAGKSTDDIELELYNKTLKREEDKLKLLKKGTAEYVNQQVIIEGIVNDRQIKEAEGQKAINDLIKEYEEGIKSLLNTIGVDFQEINDKLKNQITINNKGILETIKLKDEELEARKEAQDEIISNLEDEQKALQQKNENYLKSGTKEFELNRELNEKILSAKLDRLKTERELEEERIRQQQVLLEKDLRSREKNFLQQLEAQKEFIKNSNLNDVEKLKRTEEINESIRKVSKETDDIIKSSNQEAQNDIINTTEKFTNKATRIKKEALMEQNKDQIDSVKKWKESLSEIFTLSADTTSAVLNSISAIFTLVGDSISEKVQLIGEELGMLDKQLNAAEERRNTQLQLAEEFQGNLEESRDELNNLENTQKDVYQKIIEAQMAGNSTLVDSLKLQQDELNKKIILEKENKSVLDSGRAAALRAAKTEEDIIKKLTKERENAASKERELKQEAIELQKTQNRLSRIAALVDSAAAVAKLAVSSASKDFTFGLLTISAVTALAVSLASVIGPLVKDGFAEGGYTGNGSGAPDKSGFKVAGVVHQNEYVIPKRMVEDPKWQPTIQKLESARLRGYASGGPVSGSVENFQLQKAFVELARRPIFTSVVDINKVNSELTNTILQTRI